MRTSTRRARRALSRARLRLLRLHRIFSQAWPTNTPNRLWRLSSGMIASMNSSKIMPKPSRMRDITPARTAEITVLTVKSTKQTLHAAPHKDNLALWDTLLPYQTAILCQQCKMTHQMRNCMISLSNSRKMAMNLITPTKKRKRRGPPPLQREDAARVLSTSRSALRLRSKLSSARRSTSS